MTSSSSKNVEIPDVETLTLENENKPTSLSPKPTHILTGEYAVLMETNGKECESWYYFIRYKGNEESLQHLQDQLGKVKDWYIIDELSTFDLDLEHFVSAKTAKEMTKLELNSYAFHRKFDGKLKKITFNFKKKDLRNNERMICKVFDQLGYGQIEDYISDEDLDSEDLTDYETSSDSDSDSDDTEEESDSEEQENYNKKVENRIPPSLTKSKISQ